MPFHFTLDKAIFQCHKYKCNSLIVPLSAARNSFEKNFPFLQSSVESNLNEPHTEIIKLPYLDCTYTTYTI